MSISTTPKTLSVSWDQFHLNTLTLVRELKDKDFNRIIAISRGGLVPATIIANELGIRYIDTVSVSTYNERTQKDSVRLIKAPRPMDTVPDGNQPRALILDDITDTGLTVKFIQEWVSYQWMRVWPEDSHFVSVYVKPEGKRFINQYAVEVNQDIWVEFPWER